MYMDIDSILFDCKRQVSTSGARCWVSRIDETELSAEDVYLLYGCWAEAAAASGLIDLLHGARPGEKTYAA